MAEPRVLSIPPFPLGPGRWLRAWPGSRAAGTYMPWEGALPIPQAQDDPWATVWAMLEARPTCAEISDEG